MQEAMVNKTVLSMRLGLILSVIFVVRDLLSFSAGEGLISIVALFVSIFSTIFPFIFLFMMTVNYCCQYNDFKYEFSTPFSIAIKGFAFGGIIYTLCLYLYMSNFAPDMMENAMAESTKLIEEVFAGKGYDSYLEEWKSQASSYTLKSWIPSFYMGFMLMGLFVSLISVGAARFAKLNKPLENKKDN